MKKLLWIGYHFCILLILFFSNSGFSQSSSAHSMRVLHFTEENGLLQNSAKSFQFDSLGNLWIATEGGLVMYNGLNFKSTFSVNLPMRFAYITTDHSGTVWALDIDDGIYRIEPNKVDVIRENNPGESGSYFFWKNYTKASREELTFLDYGRFAYSPIIRSEKGIIFMIDDNWNLYSFDSSRHNLNSFADSTSIFLIGPYLLAANNYKTLWAFNETKVLDKEIEVVGDLLVSESRDFFRNSFFIPSDTCTYAIFKKSIYQLCYTPHQLLVRKVLEGIPEINNISNALYEKKSNSFVIGSRTDGFYIVQPSGFISTTHQSGGVSPSYSEVTTSVYNQVGLKNLDILDGLGYLYPRGKTTAYPINQFFAKHLWFTDAKGDIWCQSKDLSRLIRCDANGNPIQYYDMKIGEELYYMIDDFNGVYYIASKTSLYRVNIYNNVISFAKVYSKMLDNEGLYRYSDSSVWLLTRRGIYVYQKGSMNCDELESAGNYTYRYAYKSMAGNLWVSTYGNGFFLYENGRFYQMPLDRNRYLKAVHVFVEADSGKLWMSTNNGLFLVSERDLYESRLNKDANIYYQYFDKSYGFATNEFNGGCNTPAILQSDGYVSFSTMNGLLGFHPKDISLYFPDQKLYLTDLVYDNKKWINTDSCVVLPSSLKNLSFSFNTSYFGNPYNLNIEYRLLGYDSSWKRMEHTLKVSFSNLPTGAYTLEVRKLAGFGISNYVSAVVPFRISLKYYQTWWFWVISAILLAFMVALYIRLRLRQIMRRNRNLEGRISQRTSELQERLLDLDNANRQNEIITSVLVHDIKGPLKFLAEISGWLIHTWDDQKEAEKVDYVRKLNAGSVSLYDYLITILGWLKYRKANQIYYEEIRLSELVKELLPFKFHDEFRKKGVSLENRISNEIIVNSNKQILLIIITNILDNALKYTFKGSVILDACKTDEFWEFHCIDSGVGMTSEKVEYLLSPLNIGQDYSNEGSFKLGFVLIRELLPVINATIKVVSEPLKGTTVIVRF